MGRQFIGGTGGSLPPNQLYNALVGAANAGTLDEVTTNLVTNPSFETNTTGWAFSSTAGGTGARDTTTAYVGTSSYKVTAGAGGSDDGFLTYTADLLSAAQVGTFSVYIKRSDGANIVGLTQARITDAAGTSTRAWDACNPVGNGWYRCIKLLSGVAGNEMIGVFIPGGTSSVFSIDAAQVETKAYATTYTDGAVGNGYIWAGTPHGSSSQRTIPGAVFDQQLTVLAGGINSGGLVWTPYGFMSGRPTIPNARDYGCKGDGVTDDTAAIIAIIARSEKVWYFPEGTYLVNPTVVQAPLNWGNKMVIGAGINKTVFTCTTQLSALNGAPTTGAMTLTHEGQTTAAINAPLSVASIRSALEALSNVGAGNVTVTALGPDNCGTYEITWVGALALAPHTLMTVASNTLAGGPTATSVTTIYGVQGDGTHNASEYLRVAGTRKQVFKCNGLSRTGHLRDFTINGPGIASGKMANNNILGVRMDNVAGLLVSDNGGGSDGKIRMERIAIGGFDVGVEWNNNPGHTTMVGCLISGNYYNMGVTLTGNDCLVEDCLMDTASMASIGVLSGSSAGLAETMFIRTHLGNAPYGIYDERTGAPFIGACQFHRLVFEACGNGAIWSNGGAFGDVIIEHTGHYFAGSTRRIWWLPKDYAVSVGPGFGLISYDGGTQPFADGDVNTWHFTSLANTRVICRSNGPEDAVVDDGSQGRFILWRNQLPYNGTGSIANGQSTATVTLSNILPANVEGFRGNANSVDIVVVANSTTNKGGFTTPVLIASSYTPSKVAATTFVVTCLNGTCTAQLDFRYFLRSPR